MLITSILTLGLPLLALTWFVFDHLLESGELERENVNDQLKALKKRQKSEEDGQSSLLTQRWMKFGGGFYGLAALYTFVMVEIADISNFLFNFPGIAALLEDGIISLLIHALINQIMNFVTAVTWFIYWGDGSRVLENMFVAYAGYYAGMQLALRDIIRQWLDTDS